MLLWFIFLLLLFLESLSLIDTIFVFFLYKIKRLAFNSSIQETEKVYSLAFASVKFDRLFLLLRELDLFLQKLTFIFGGFIVKHVYIQIPCLFVIWTL